MWPKKLSNKNGFTLVEIIVVLIILAILAAFTIPTYLGYVKNSKVLMDESTLGLLNRTTQAYRTSHHHNDPTTDPFSDHSINNENKSSKDLLDVLIAGDYLSATDVIPKTAEANFAWTPGAIGKGRWSLALANQTEYATVEEARAAGFEFEDNGNGYTITNYGASMGLDVVIPGKIAGKEVPVSETTTAARRPIPFKTRV
ncbi:MAG: prepilin-type N-terminal cleavage/methylation domain-containing protein [Candidatus Cloacimonetes bacterium]|nr:prepilin-type N-terminal cleavage/methylation domain-containing protein [Candidatus Cloacimonadota bacterium]MDY0230636.1 prepilin-type N-terminal cleavage/methylation domain-containing protein [Candidatus Cloacimonadaceae bacterium]